jgi:hypothetical protein
VGRRRDRRRVQRLHERRSRRSPRRPDLRGGVGGVADLVGREAVGGPPALPREGRTHPARPAEVREAAARRAARRGPGVGGHRAAPDHLRGPGRRVRRDVDGRLPGHPRRAPPGREEPHCGTAAREADRAAAAVRDDPRPRVRGPGRRRGSDRRDRHAVDRRPGRAGHRPTAVDVDRPPTAAPTADRPTAARTDRAAFGPSTGRRSVGRADRAAAALAENIALLRKRYPNGLPADYSYGQVRGDMGWSFERAKPAVDGYRAGLGADDSDDQEHQLAATR